MSYTVSEYIDRKEACDLIGVAPSTMSAHFKIIKERYPNSVDIKGKVNRKDFEHYFNIGSSYRRKVKENV